MRKLGLLELLAARSRAGGASLAEICASLERPRYPVQVLLEAGLGAGILYRTPTSGEAPERYLLAKTGYVLHGDRMTSVLIDFMQDVCYQGMCDLEQALETGEPAGLRRLGDWPTLYVALVELPPPVRESWLAYDHYFSDCTFDQALEIVFDPAPRSLLDIGGNTGKWALRCVARDPAVRVTVLDLPQQIALMERTIAGRPGADRIAGIGKDLLDDAARISGGFDAVWMSQFLDCFDEEAIVRILKRAAASMSDRGSLYINEIFWDRQRFETAAFVLTQSSPYFTAIANGRSKFLYFPDLVRCIESAGLTVDRLIDGLGWGHTLIRCRNLG
jgi:hypothetical protein